ncbi:family 2A encapsulin nanocompartment cargo protein cysteine desulfurase [Planktothricoides raciborskii]|uniref:cysteine desulfurase n=1 Tax=Planktothricoides raciborskii GIHE-MW2 TaxID=2792601 RepID=A0AAU8JI48_9CYAN
MTTPNLYPENSLTEGPAKPNPSPSVANVGGDGINPLFKADTFEQLANAFIQEVKRSGIDVQLPDALNIPQSVQDISGPGSNIHQQNLDGKLPSVSTPHLPVGEPQFYFSDPGVDLPHPPHSVEEVRAAASHIPKKIPQAIATPATPTVPNLSLASVPTPSIPTVTPNFYFLEHLSQGVERQKPDQNIPKTVEDYSPQNYRQNSPIDPFFVPLAAVTKQDIFDVETIRRDFPILQEKVNGKPLIWFDNAATTQKPQAVIDRLVHYYSHENSNIHRAAHELAARSTDAYEASRETVRHFINASSVNEIIFVRGTTEAINLVAKSWGEQNIKAGDEIVLSHLEHHANIVPWQQLATRTGAKLRIAPVDDRGQILLEEYQQLLNPRTKLVAFSQVSNALGTITPAAKMIALAHQVGAKVLLDGAQSVSHIPIDVQQLGCDWFVFSGHKIFGPTGIGVVYGHEDLLNASPPWQSGGNMIVDVTFERTVYQNSPARFEAGTGNIADAVGLATALDYVQQIGLPNIARYEHELLEYATTGLNTIPGLHLIGTAPEKAAVLSFVLDGFSAETVGQALNQEGIAVRAGHHCAQPILRRFGLEATVRPSLAFYNTKSEVDALVHALERIRQKQLG